MHDDVGLRNAKAYFGRAEVADYLQELSKTELKSARKLLDAAGLDYKMKLRTGHIAEVWNDFFDKCAMKPVNAQHALLLDGLDGDEVHRRPRQGFADRCRQAKHAAEIDAQAVRFGEPSMRRAAAVHAAAAGRLQT